MFDDSHDLAERVRAALSHDDVREVRMFGGLCFMLNDKLLVGTMKDGSLLVRIDPDRNAELCERPGTSTPEMGGGRSMGPGWVAVDAETANADLGFWLAEARDFNPRATASRRTAPPN